MRFSVVWSWGLGSPLEDWLRLPSSLPSPLKRVPLQLAAVLVLIVRGKRRLLQKGVLGKPTLRWAGARTCCSTGQAGRVGVYTPAKEMSDEVIGEGTDQVITDKRIPSYSAGERRSQRGSAAEEETLRTVSGQLCETLSDVKAEEAGLALDMHPAQGAVGEELIGAKAAEVVSANSEADSAVPRRGDTSEQATEVCPEAQNLVETEQDTSDDVEVEPQESAEGSVTTEDAPSETGVPVFLRPHHKLPPDTPYEATTQHGLSVAGGKRDTFLKDLVACVREDVIELRSPVVPSSPEPKGEGVCSLCDKNSQLFQLFSSLHSNCFHQSAKARYRTHHYPQQ